MAGVAEILPVEETLSEFKSSGAKAFFKRDRKTKILGFAFFCAI
jgi:hypothetical protein